MIDEHNAEPSLPAVYPADSYELASAEAYPMAPEMSSGPDWRRLTALLWRRRWWILASTILGLAGGVAGSRLVKPSYQTSATIWLERGGGRSGPIQSQQVQSGEGWGNLLRSFAVLEPVVEQLKLYLQPLSDVDPDSHLFLGFGLNDQFVPGTFELRADSSGGYELSRDGTGVVERGQLGGPIGKTVGMRWTPPADAIQPGADIKFLVRTPRQGAGLLRSALNVRYDPNASLLVMNLTWNDPHAAASILNTLQKSFIQTATKLKNEKLRQTVAILAEQERYTEERLRAAELALENNRIATVTLPSQSDGAALPGGEMTRGPVFNRFFQQKIRQDQIKTDIARLTSLLTAVRAGKPLDVLALRSIPSVRTTSPGLQSQLAELDAKEAALRALLITYTERAPAVLSAKEEIDIVKRESLPRLMEELVAQLRSEANTVAVQIAAQTGELQQVPARAIEDARLQREMEAAATLQGDLQSRLKQAELAEATNLPDMQVLDRAVPPTLPTNDTAPRIIMMAALAGIGIGVGLVLLLDLLDMRIRYPEQLSRSLGLPVLGVVPRLDVRDRSNSPIADITIESFRAIRTQIAHSRAETHGLTLITSPAPRDGKSMVAANLAISYAGAGLRTALVDADTKRGHAEEMFGLERSPGFTDYLLDRSALTEVFQETSVDGLSLMARGRSTGFNVELLNSGRMDGLIEILRNQFDVVVVDAPPLAAGADALVLGERCDKVVIVIRAGETDSDVARTKLQMIGNVDLPIIGAILNAVPRTTDYYRYYTPYYYSDAETA